MDCRPRQVRTCVVVQGKGSRLDLGTQRLHVDNNVVVSTVGGLQTSKVPCFDNTCLVPDEDNILE